MIGYLKGTLVLGEEDSAIIECQGVGYSVTMTPNAVQDLVSLNSATCQVWIYTHVREDALQLFGFNSRAEKEFFTQLLKVNGVGPKSAMTIMSGASLGHIQSWIEDGDAKALSLLPKVGKKTAEQIVLTLKGKLVKIESSSDSKKKSNSLKSLKPLNLQHISSALVNLGFKPQIVDAFIETLPENAGVEESVRSGLQKLSGQI